MEGLVEDGDERMLLHGGLPLCLFLAFVYHVNLDEWVWCVCGGGGGGGDTCVYVGGYVCVCVQVKVKEEGVCVVIEEERQYDWRVWGS